MATIKVFIVTSVLMVVYIFVSVLAIISFVDIGLKDRANEIYKRVEDQKSSRGRNQDALLAACLYIACRQEDKPRTVKGTTSKQFLCVLFGLVDMFVNNPSSCRNMFCCQWSY